MLFRSCHQCPQPRGPHCLPPLLSFSRTRGETVGRETHKKPVPASTAAAELTFSSQRLLLVPGTRRNGHELLGSVPSRFLRFSEACLLKYPPTTSRGKFITSSSKRLQKNSQSPFHHPKRSKKSRGVWCRVSLFVIQQSRGAEILPSVALRRLKR